MEYKDFLDKLSNPARRGLEYEDIIDFTKLAANKLENALKYFPWYNHTNTTLYNYDKLVLIFSCNWVIIREEFVYIHKWIWK